MEIFGIAALIFLVTDPFGNIAIFIAALKNVPEKRRLRVAARELLFALALLLLFLTFGDKVLSALGLSREATAIAGGIILFVIAMRLIFPGPQGVLGDVPDGEPMLVPLATPSGGRSLSTGGVDDSAQYPRRAALGALRRSAAGLGGDRIYSVAGLVAAAFSWTSRVDRSGAADGHAIDHAQRRHAAG